MRERRLRETTGSRTGRGARHEARRILLAASLGALSFGLAPLPSAFAGPCDISVELDATPRDPADGAVVTYTLTYCDPPAAGGEVFGATIALNRALFVPLSGTWISCPIGTCDSGDPDGSLSISGFDMPPGACFPFVFSMELQPGLGGDEVCIAADTTVKSNNPPSSPFPCPKDSDDPDTPAPSDPTCVTIEDLAPGCTVTAAVDPTFLSACVGAGDVLSAADSSATGCPGGTLNYQWTRDGVDIPGATSATYAIPATTPAGAAQYRAFVSCAGLPVCNDLSVKIDVFLFGPEGELVVPESACSGEDVDVFVSGAGSCSIDCGAGGPPVASCFTTCSYPAPGDYTVTAEVSGGECTGELTQEIGIIDTPIACITEVDSVCETNPRGPSLILLENCSSVGLDYDWTTTLGSFADPGARDPELSLPNVTSPTRVTIGLGVSSPGGCGAPDDTEWDFELLPSPIATAAHMPIDACAGETIRFEGAASDTPGPFRYEWDFGDSFTSTLEDPTHAYAAVGTYDVSLTVTDASNGCETTVSDSVTIGDSCCAVPPPVVTRLVAYKSPTSDDVTLEWTALPEATGGYNVWRTNTKLKIDDAREGPPDPDIIAVCHPTALTSCVEAGAVPGPGDTVFFYQTRGLCGSAEGD